MLFGKHKLAPVVSPKKTVEGAVGGVVGGAVLVLIAAVIMNRTLDLEMPLWSAVVLGAVGAVLGEIGDLSFSVIKRQTGIKDYGHIFRDMAVCWTASTVCCSWRLSPNYCSVLSGDVN